MYRREKSELGETLLKVSDLQLKPDGPKVSFELHKGEVLGVAGMVGAGRTEIAEALFGCRKAISGRIREKTGNLVGNMASQGTTPR